MKRNHTIGSDHVAPSFIYCYQIRLSRNHREVVSFSFPGNYSSEEEALMNRKQLIKEHFPGVFVGRTGTWGGGMNLFRAVFIY